MEDSQEWELIPDPLGGVEELKLLGSDSPCTRISGCRMEAVGAGSEGSCFSPAESVELHVSDGKVFLSWADDTVRLGIGKQVF